MLCHPLKGENNLYQQALRANLLGDIRARYVGQLFCITGMSDGFEREESASLKAQPWPGKVFKKGELVEVESLSNNCMYVIILYFIKFEARIPR